MSALSLLASLWPMERGDKVPGIEARRALGFDTPPGIETRGVIGSGGVRNKASDGQDGNRCGGHGDGGGDFSVQYALGLMSGWLLGNVAEECLDRGGGRAHARKRTRHLALMGRTRNITQQGGGGGGWRSWN